jgi:hypothetical protein
VPAPERGAGEEEPERGEHNEIGFRNVDEQGEHDEAGGTQGEPGEPERIEEE